MEGKPRCEMKSALIVAMLTLLVGPGVNGGRAILYQFMGPVPNSHFLLQDRVATELAARGHTVLVVAGNDTLSSITKAEGILVADYSVTTPRFEVSRGLFKAAMFIDNKVHPHLLVGVGMAKLGEDCRAMISNTSLMQRLRDFDADVIFHDVMVACANVLAAKLDVPLVSIQSGSIFETWFNSWNAGSPFRWHLPNPIAYNPQIRSLAPPVMSFLQRVHNSWLYLIGQLINTLIVDPPVVRCMQSLGVDLTKPGSKGRAVMLLVNADFAVEPPRPLPPHVKMVGPLMVQPTKPLPPDLEAYLGESEVGVVLVAAGTLMIIEQEPLREIGRALSRLPVRVLWKVSKQEVADQAALDALHLADNVKVVTTWLPQNELLAHNKTVAFLTHCGVNSVYEAMWHGKPIVGLPGGADQPDNAAHVAHQGAGIALPYAWHIKEAQIYDALMRVLREPSFTHNAQQISKRLRAHKRTGRQRAVDWIEHVMETKGVPYLRPPVDELPFFVRHSLDVMAFWAACFGLPMWAWYRKRTIPGLQAPRPHQE